MSNLRDLMEETHSAHKNFKKEWEDWRNGKLKKNKKAKGTTEPESVKNARDEFFRKLDVLYSLKLEPLEKKFRSDPHSAISEVAEFLTIDIPAHRCGYAKEGFLQWLKNVELTAAEIELFQRISLKICETDNIRREFRRWCRLMIKLADEEFILNLKSLMKSDELFTRLKSRWMFDSIRKHRSDLGDV